MRSTCANVPPTPANYAQRSGACRTVRPGSTGGYILCRTESSRPALFWQAPGDGEWHRPSPGPSSSRIVISSNLIFTRYGSPNPVRTSKRTSRMFMDLSNRPTCPFGRRSKPIYPPATSPSGRSWRCSESLESVSAELNASNAPWAADRDAFAAAVSAAATWKILVCVRTLATTLSECPRPIDGSQPEIRDAWD